METGFRYNGSTGTYFPDLHLLFSPVPFVVPVCQYYSGATIGNYSLCGNNCRIIIMDTICRILYLEDHFLAGLADEQDRPLDKPAFFCCMG